ncbi:hypothetical protein CTAYLR_005743 [Chrysophaeum taylorii]|uniref:Intraflagellar transport protein 22 homolog n=1 Tax=Chrysophaeum taylorii TaxID=2483200 RepID=A0AAD7UIQ8_9STRA|nr:hypothetical protein CTAYLR_005743 [Chrysophaeum taylorii]
MSAAPKGPPGLKISVVGPSGSGKSTIANYLASESEGSSAFKVAPTYTQTVGCRILECERTIDGPLMPIELWDTGGSTDYESCWPAVMKDTDGVVLVYNPENEGHVSESGAWYDFFVKNNSLSDDQCIVFAFAPNAQPEIRPRTSPKLQHLNVVNITIEDGQTLLHQFDRFLRQVKKKLDTKAKKTAEFK